MLVVAVVFLLTACAEPAPGSAGSPQASPTAKGSKPQGRELYESNAIVLEDRKRGPHLCIGAIASSYPPQCGDIPLAGWDWGDVKGEERALGVTWGGPYHVVGTFDGQRFTLTEDPGSAQKALDPKDEFDSGPACEEPEGGWITDGNVDQDVAGRALAAVRGEPDYAAGWVTQLEPPAELEDSGPVVLNAGFTGDLERPRRSYANAGAVHCVSFSTSARLTSSSRSAERWMRNWRRGMSTRSIRVSTR